MAYRDLLYCRFIQPVFNQKHLYLVMGHSKSGNQPKVHPINTKESLVKVI